MLGFFSSRLQRVLFWSDARARQQTKTPEREQLLVWSVSVRLVAVVLCDQPARSLTDTMASDVRHPDQLTRDSETLIVVGLSFS